MLEQRYNLGPRLATGGMSEIFLATDQRSREPVVIKRLFANLVSQRDILLMFRHEGELLLKLRHRLIPRVFDLGSHNGTPVIVMEYLRAHSVGQFREAKGPLPLDAWVALGAQLLEGLANVHDQRGGGGASLEIIHRDVTPDNVLVTADGTVKLIDFGIASSSLRPAHHASAMAGTTGYIAPEIIDERPAVDARVDLFSAGAVLYETALGVRLFRGNKLEVMNATVDGQFARPREIQSNFPTILETFLLKALALRASDRFASATAMLTELRAAATTLGISESATRLGSLIMNE